MSGRSRKRPTELQALQALCASLNKPSAVMVSQEDTVAEMQLMLTGWRGLCMPYMHPQYFHAMLVVCTRQAEGWAALHSKAAAVGRDQMPGVGVGRGGRAAGRSGCES
ncbi:MAG: hypothetical protein WDW38_001339 [Sanguina aurantia]